MSMLTRSIPSLARFASSSSSSTGSHKVVVIGAGAGGLAVANQVYNALKASGQKLADGDVAIIDPAATHDYQPGWTVVGSGLESKETFRRPMDALIPSYFAHIKAAATNVEPQSGRVVLDDGSKVGYDFLIVAPGLQINYDKISGLKDALADPLKSKVSTIYNYDTVDKTWDLIKGYSASQGEAIFTQPFGPVKCAGAPQKIAYMADSYWKSVPQLAGALPARRFVTGMPTMFSVPFYSDALNKLRQEKGIDAEFNTDLVAVDAANKTATFQVLAGEKKGEKVTKEFGLLHVVPPMGPVDWVKKSPLADAAGWVDVNPATLQHAKYDNVFSLGDASSLPTSKTAAAITSQAPVLAANLVSLIQNGKLSGATYDGYTSCPLFTGRGELLLAEFKYGLERKETFGALVDQSKPNRLFYHLTKDVFPRAYFAKMLKGEWYGPRGVFPPQF